MRIKEDQQDQDTGRSEEITLPEMINFADRMGRFLWMCALMGLYIWVYPLIWVCRVAFKTFTCQKNGGEK